MWMFNYIAKANNLLIQDQEGGIVWTREGIIASRSATR